MKGRFRGAAEGEGEGVGSVEDGEVDEVCREDAVGKGVLVGFNWERVGQYKGGTICHGQYASAPSPTELTKGLRKHIRKPPPLPRRRRKQKPIRRQHIEILAIT